MNLLTLTENAKELPTIVILLIIVVFFGLIVLTIVLVKKFVKPLQIDKTEISEEEVVKEELDRVLVPIEDEKIQQQMAEDMKKNAK